MLWETLLISTPRRNATFARLLGKRLKLSMMGRPPLGLGLTCVTTTLSRKALGWEPVGDNASSLESDPRLELPLTKATKTWKTYLLWQAKNSHTRSDPQPEKDSQGNFVPPKIDWKNI
jgi:hypothetical protein